MVGTASAITPAHNYNLWCLINTTVVPKPWGLQPRQRDELAQRMAEMAATQWEQAAEVSLVVSIAAAAGVS